MKVLDLDMDYFLKANLSGIRTSETDRLPAEYYSDCVWTEAEVRGFFENNLGLSKDKRTKGRIVQGHNEALSFWKELIEQGSLSKPFDVIHVDSHADLGLGYSSWVYILRYLLKYPVEERPLHPRHRDVLGRMRTEEIGDYLLFAIAYRWISKLVYCGNPYMHCDDYLWITIKDFYEKPIWNEPVELALQLLYNPFMDFPKNDDTDIRKSRYIEKSHKEPEVPFLIIPSIKDVHFRDFDYAVLAQSPNYTPASADYIISVFREYIIEE